jgi:hypothetical protein
VVTISEVMLFEIEVIPEIIEDEKEGHAPLRERCCRGAILGFSNERNKNMQPTDIDVRSR